MIPTDAAALLDRVFAEPVALSTRKRASIHRHLSGLGIAGGAVYDGLVAMEASEHGLTLLSRDARALSTYQLVGAHVERLVATA